MEQHPFEPIIFADSEILILGSFPSLKSLETAFYYGHPRNQFWKILNTIYDEKAVTAEERIALCRKHRIALWDSAKSIIRGAGNSSDAKLSALEPNDIAALLRSHPSIRMILFTGKKAEQIYNRHFKELPIKTALLPSPSPAYQFLPFEEKVQNYRTLLPKSD